VSHRHLLQTPLARRAFLKGTVAVGALLGLQTLAACVPVQTPAGSATSAGTSPAPKVVRLSHNLFYGGRESLVPGTRTPFGAVNNLIYERLVRHSPTGQAEPWLAESWTPNETATVWTFNLRQGVTFHDGKAFTAQDAVYSIQRITDPELRSGLVRFLEVVDVEGIKAVDDATLEIPLKEPYADFPVVLPALFPIIADGSGPTIGETGNGTGAFKLEKAAPEGTSVVVANDNYWGGRPQLDRIEIVPVADAQARVNALLADQIDYTDTLDIAQAALIGQNPNYIFENVVDGTWYGFALRTDQAPFDDVRVRLALKLVMDRDLLIKTVVQGNGIPAADQPVYPGDASALQIDRPRDVERAKALLTEAGYADGLEITMHTTDALGAINALAVTYKELAAEAGINVTIENHDPDQFWGTVYMQQPCFATAGSNMPTPFMLDLLFRAGSPFNEPGWSSDKMEELLGAARQELDAEKRTAIYHEAQQLIADEGGLLIPFFTGMGRAYHKKLSGIDASAVQIDWTKVMVDEAA
jgi:peptide/nickel transport system substrate-binding protein